MQKEEMRTNLTTQLRIQLPPLTKKIIILVIPSSIYSTLLNNPKFNSKTLNQFNILLLLVSLKLETYDGTKDPNDHLHAFYSCMQAQNASDALMCKIFPSTLCGNAQTWYYSLPPRSISSYTEMTSAVNSSTELWVGEFTPKEEVLLQALEVLAMGKTEKTR
ncbi:hypothetical protein SLEP1_g16979 [Rubroshorea leprosula]|uniref:Retrotransposon gag domain-containing protein n=1 Tax=Rubroshorea leprosula TaxID=152421 RepID=A0AAV5J363_9ROSI|nr:hypothetical protein SLEP1_g16979 [Rubroshorea leprosula]